MDQLWLGLVAWIGVGSLAGLLARSMLPGVPRLGWPSALGTGVAGSLGGGLLATWLGFGGLASLDWRSALFACLCAMIALLVLRSLTLAEETTAG